MSFLIQLFVVSAAILAAFAASSTFKVTTGEQDYATRAQADLLVEINLAEKELLAFNIRFDDRFDLVKLQQLKSLNDTQQANQTFISQQVLSYARKYCIQKHYPQLITYERAEFEFKTCNTKGNTMRLNSDSLQLATSYFKRAENYALLFFPYYTRNCDSYSNQTLLENCYLSYVHEGRQVIHGYLDAFRKNLEMASFQMEDISQELVSCSFNTIKEVLFSISTTTFKINICVDEMKNKNISSYIFGRKNLIQ